MGLLALEISLFLAVSMPYVKVRLGVRVHPAGPMSQLLKVKYNIPLERRSATPRQGCKFTAVHALLVFGALLSISISGAFFIDPSQHASKMVVNEAATASTPDVHPRMLGGKPILNVRDDEPRPRRTLQVRRRRAFIPLRCPPRARKPRVAPAPANALSVIRF